jgi:hypothetical protein
MVLSDVQAKTKENSPPWGGCSNLAPRFRVSYYFNPGGGLQERNENQRAVAGGPRLNTMGHFDPLPLIPDS